MNRETEEVGELVAGCWFTGWEFLTGDGRRGTGCDSTRTNAFVWRI